jgi:hypothetical protein
MMLDVTTRQAHRHQRRRGQDAAARALVLTPSRGLGAFDLDRKSSPAMQFLFDVPMKFDRVSRHYGILSWS